MRTQNWSRAPSLLVFLVLVLGGGLVVGYGSRPEDPSRVLPAASTPIKGIAQPLPALEDARPMPPVGNPAVASTAEAAGPAQLLTATCRDLESASSLDADAVPVVVTYMVSNRLPRDDVSTVFTLDRMRKGFKPAGEFNRIWGPKGITFALAKIRACQFTLDASVNESIGIPDPDTGNFFQTLFIPTLKAYNTRTLQIGGERVDFHGLDLYLWQKMRGYPGYGVRPRFGLSEEKSQRPDEPREGRAGGIWMDSRCTKLDNMDTCAGYFAHEVGHFLGLCHCCRLGTGEGPPLKCFNYLTADYCESLLVNESPRDSCNIADLGKRLMNAANAFPGVSTGSLDSVRIEACEVVEAQAVREKVLRLGANGVKP